MLKVTVSGFVIWPVLAMLSVPVNALEPVPRAKPLEPPNKQPFIEGVDLPQRKPNRERERAETPIAPSAAPMKCNLTGATYSLLPDINGERSGDAGCGVEAPVRLTAIMYKEASVSFKNPVTVSCEFARVLTKWLQIDALPAAEQHFKAGVGVIGTGPGYQCRRRNNLPDGKLSEHALGKAVDISGFKMRDGSSVSVETDWGQETAQGLYLKAIHKSACERFTTVLSPEGDEFHKSHMHLDIGCHGKTCTYLICQ